ncbi:phosphate/phosphite/phosphonate ABC transporter substrate-binding protein [Tropicibacter sp. S64]|uniref:phosphate/phosphite/phosphonate ABC transporter substrate-binding protein n=1 Tax=Tropicibacter sp. S64 TaxID=3415122 RepID=UPI003C799CF6
MPFQIRQLLVGALVCVLTLLPVTTAAEERYTFGIVPQFEARQLAETWKPILEELHTRTGHRFEMVGSPRIPEFEAAFVQGDFDFAYMNPYHALVAGDRQGYRAIVRDGGRQLYGVLVVARDSPFRSVADLEGRTIAFPAPNALGAALLMRADLDRNFGLHYSARYVATHSSAYYNVLLGQADAAGGVMATLNSQDDLVRHGLRILYETTRLPPHPISVHPRVPKEVADAVQQAFIDMAQTESGAAMLAQVPIKRPVMATQDDYEGLRKLELQSYFVRPPQTGG